uniref:Kinesin motor domain-containing protein n=1 Tax=Aureoumbra lagunensis TaxID=44058 RepID=A0A7S3K6E1_9STRA
MSSESAREARSSRDAIYVAVRVRPMPLKAGKSGNWCAVAQDDGKTLLAVRDERKGGAYLKSQQATESIYEFDATFGPKATQEEIYETTFRRSVISLALGEISNATIMAYGATSAGKTHTILGEGSLRHGGMGNIEEEASFGVIPRAVSTLFEVLGGNNDTVKVSYLELYNEKVYDLLSGNDFEDGDPANEDNSRRKAPLLVCEDEKNGIVKVLGLAALEASSAAQVMDLVRRGSSRRTTEATGANDVSSRSHAVLMLTVGGRTVSMVDLAGSERASATGNRGARLAEAAAINRSLLALANCINALTDPTAPKPKFRDSKLTLLLKNSLEHSPIRPVRLVVLACVSPAMCSVEDTHNTLKYAHRAKTISAFSRAASDSTIDTLDNNTTIADGQRSIEKYVQHPTTNNIKQQHSISDSLLPPPPKPARGAGRRSSVAAPGRRFSVTAVPVPGDQDEESKKKNRFRRGSLVPPQPNAPLGELRKASSIAVAEARAAAIAAAQSFTQKNPPRPKRRANRSQPPPPTTNSQANVNTESLRRELDKALDNLRDAEDRAERWKAIARDGREQIEAIAAVCRACAVLPDDIGALKARWNFLESDLEAARHRFERALIDDDLQKSKITSQYQVIDKRTPLSDHNTVPDLSNTVKRCVLATSPPEKNNSSSQEEQLPSHQSNVATTTTQ